MMYLRPDLMPLSFDEVMSLKGNVYRELDNRRTQRVVLQGKAYFVKKHFGVGWVEIIKNLFQLRLPIISAKNEWRALQRLDELGVLVPRIAGFGSRGINPATMQSFMMTDELPVHTTLEDICKVWPTTGVSFLFKTKLIKEVARIARTLHENGINHRDFYICHFLLSHPMDELKLYLIDLHRAQIRKKIPERWLIKDLAALYFSSKEIGLTKRDLLRFIREYRNTTSLKIELTQRTVFWQKVKHRGDKLYQKHTR